MITETLILEIDTQNSKFLSSKKRFSKSLQLPLILLGVNLNFKIEYGKIEFIIKYKINHVLLFLLN